MTLVADSARVESAPLTWRGRVLPNRALVMGILNVTPDSFSDGGAHVDPSRALDRALAMVEAGADVIDIGAESTRPGSAEVSESEELRRLEPLLDRVVSKACVPVSVDTRKAIVAEHALQAGCAAVNDVTGGRGDADMLSVVARHGAGFVAMHMRGTPKTMQDDPCYDDVIGEIRDELGALARAALGAGIPVQGIMVDPGIGFGKTTEHNLRILSELHRCVDLGYPVLVGTSRKRFVGEVTGASVENRMPGTAATVTAAVLGGATMVRVHDVEFMVPVVRMAEALRREQGAR